MDLPSFIYLCKIILSMWASLIIAQLVKNPPAMQETPVQFLDQEYSLEKGQATHSSILGFPCGSAGKESTCNAGDLDSISGSGRSPGEGDGNPLWYSCLENPVDREAQQAIVHGVAKSRKQLSDLTFTFKLFCKGEGWNKCS